MSTEISEALKHAQRCKAVFEVLAKAVDILQAAKAAEGEKAQREANIRGLQKDYYKCSKQTADARELFAAERARQNDELVLYETKIEQARDNAEKIVTETQKQCEGLIDSTNKQCEQMLAAAEQGADERLNQQKNVEAEIVIAEAKLDMLRSEIKRIAEGASGE